MRYRSRTPKLHRTGHPVSEKFGNDPITEYLYNWLGDGSADSESGDVHETGTAYALFTAPMFPDMPDNPVELSEEEQDELRNAAGAILEEDSYGFVSATLYDSKTELEARWAEIEQEQMEAAGPQDDDWIVLEVGDNIEARDLPLNHLVLTGPADKRNELIRAEMDRQGYSPNVWFISDHGNAHLLNVMEDD